VTRSSLLHRYHSIVDDPAALEAALQRPLDRFVWTNRLRILPDALFDLLDSDGFRLTPLEWFPGAFRVAVEPAPLGGHWAYQAGLLHIQEASSMIPVRLLAPRPGMRILDLCAAPGNKTVQTAVEMDNRGTVIANDLRYHRMSSIRMHVDRLGLVNVSTTCWDGGSYPRNAGLFDAVLVDVPCSCEGTSRKTPDIFQRPVPGRRRLLQRQRLLLERAVRMCRSGGKIVYSTCTYDPEENEAVVDAVLRGLPGRLRIVPVSMPGLQSSPGVTGWQDARYDESLQHTLRVWPHQNDTGGFFAVVLERTGEALSEPVPVPTLSESGTDSGKAGDSRPFPEPEQILSLLSKRFGIESTALEGLRLLQRNRRQVFVAAGDHRPTPEPASATGMPLMHLSMKTPKLTTAGASFLGPHARRNVIEVDAGQRDRYLVRQPFSLRPEQVSPDSGDGHVLIRHRRAVLGVGEIRKDAMEVTSLYPKRLASGLRNGE
jgi:NOL1/NOP2/sun family putative RNA methylase